MVFNNPARSQVEGKMNSAKTLQGTAQMAITARRSIQRTQVAARLNLPIIKMVVKVAALLVERVAALLGVSSTYCIAVHCYGQLLFFHLLQFVSDESTDTDVKPLYRIVQELDTDFADHLAEIQKSAVNKDRVEIQSTGSADNISYR